MLYKLGSDVCYEEKSSREGGQRVRGERKDCLCFSVPWSRKASVRLCLSIDLKFGKSESCDCLGEEHSRRSKYKALLFHPG